MARERITLLLAIGVLAATASGAAAKSFVQPDPPTRQTQVGAAVVLDAQVASESVGPLAHVHPVVIARRQGTHDVLRFRAARATGSGGSAKLTVSFPRAGLWFMRVAVPGRRIMYEGESSILVQPAAGNGAVAPVAPARSSGGDGGGPSALVWILSGIALLTAFVVWAMWRRRPAAT